MNGDHVRGAGLRLDSLELLEELVAAVGEIGVDLPGRRDEHDLGSNYGFARVVTEQGGPAALAQFCGAWR
jgi:hypothetical protein